MVSTQTMGCFNVNTALQLYALGDMSSATTRGPAMQCSQGKPKEVL